MSTGNDPRNGRGRPDAGRRNLIKTAGMAAAASVLPVSLIELAWGKSGQNFTIGYISDSHIQQIEGTKFVRNWDRGLIRAVAETNLLNPKPDFVVFGGDLAQLGNKPELDHGMELLSKLNYKIYGVMGEHDYYLDYGQYWEKVFGHKQWYSFDHKGVHFIVLNSILTYDEWNNKWPTAEQRMLEMAGLDNPNGSPFLVGEAQRAWLAKDLKKVKKDTPIVVFSHSPLQKIFKNWNFWTDDAEEVQALLAPFDQVNVIYGHVHQIQYNQIGNIAFNSVMATAWPWPYPQSYTQAESFLPKLTVQMNRADPFFERDATGWQLVDINSGRTRLNFNLYNNTNRTVAWNERTRQPEDTVFQAEGTRITPQSHY